MSTRLGGTVVIAVGDEIVGGFLQDTNSRFLAERLRSTAHPCLRLEAVGDDPGEIAAAVRRAAGDGRVTRVLVCGGLGPTPDDRTFEGVAGGLGRPLAEDARVLERLEGIVRRMHEAGWIEAPLLSAANRRMATVPAGGDVVDNRRGMAPAMAYALDGDGGGVTAARRLFVLPGVPRELRTIFDEELLGAHFGGTVDETVVELRYPFAIEAEFAEPMNTLRTEFPAVRVGSYPQSETRELLLRLRGDDAEQVQRAARRLDELRQPLKGNSAPAR